MVKEAASSDSVGLAPCCVYPEGSYLMHRYRPSQYLPNNYKFSPCSLRQMYPVITLKGGCLIRYTGPTCGNAVVEEGEECDCGLSGACQAHDPCCTPGDVPPSSADPPCTVRRSLGLECSPLTFTCCSDVCKHINLADRYVCREAGECYSQASCDGHSPLCPVPAFLPDGAPCHVAVRGCSQGRCGQSLCVQAGLQECFCRDRPDDRCKLCCRSLHGSQCRPAHDFNITAPEGHVLYLPEGDGCLDYRGVCTLSSNRMVCVTTDDLDGEVSELVGLQSGEPSGRGAWLHMSWFYFILIPLLFVFTTALIFYGRNIYGKFRNLLKDNRTADSSGKLQAVLTLAHSQLYPEPGKTSAVCDRRRSPPTSQHRPPFQPRHQWHRQGFVHGTATQHPHDGRQFEREGREGRLFNVEGRCQLKLP
ncbi:hypothetical protein ACOMHN_018002 [Nucella lapillus]